jgi:hypothetical protein
MPIIRLDLDDEALGRLADLAIEERRPIPWQAEVLLLRALGLPAPPPLSRVTVEAAKSEGAPHGH